MSRFILSSFARNALISLTLGTPVAYGQTPHDLARLAFAPGTTVSVSTLTTSNTNLAGHGGPVDVASLTGTDSASTGANAAPRSGVNFSTAAGASDLARMMGVTPAVSLRIAFAE